MSYKKKERCYKELREECLRAAVAYAPSCIGREVCVSREPCTEYINVSTTRSEQFDNKTFQARSKKDRLKRGKVWLLNKRGINRYHAKIPMRHSFKTMSRNSLIRFKHKSSNYLSERYSRKFVLPSHSLHSSRIIKPNKRFIDVERNSKSKIFLKAGSSFTSNTSCAKSDLGEKDSLNCYRKKSSNAIPSNKVIIREARLNIISEPVLAGPFSSKRNVSEKGKFYKIIF